MSDEIGIPVALLSITVRNDGFGTSLLIEDFSSRISVLMLSAEIPGWLKPMPLCLQPRSPAKERDTETGLDYFGARYYGSTMGRWMSPDWSAAPVPVPYADLGNPQALNLYSYVQNNPVTGVDPDGHFCLQLAKGDGDCAGLVETKPTVEKQNPADMTTRQFLKEEVKGVTDVTVTPVVNAVTHPLDTIQQAFEGFSLMTKPSALKEAGSQAVSEVKQTASSALQGNPRAIGQVVGTAATVAYGYSSSRNYAATSKGGPGGFGMNFQLTSKNFVRFDIHRLHFSGQPVNLVPHFDFKLGPFSGAHWPW